MALRDVFPAPVSLHAHWDGEAGVWSVSSTDVPGLHIEAAHFDDIPDRVSVAMAGRDEFDPKLGTFARRPIVIHASRTRDQDYLPSSAS